MKISWVSNANVGNNFSSKLLRIASEANKASNLGEMPKEMAKLHENGDLYFHDLDSLNLAPNCLHVPTGRILRKGFNTGYGTLNPPKRIESAGELSCILLQSSQNDLFGGQSHCDFDNDLGYFVGITRKEIKKEYINILSEYNINEDRFNQIVEEKLHERVRQAMQGVVYNLNTMHSRAGSQVPFSSVNIGLPDNDDAALVCKCFLEEYDKGLGKGEQAIFPNIIFRVKEGVNRNPQDKYYYLYKLACKVSSSRMNPTFMNIDSSFNKKYYEMGIKPATMGCRTYLMDNINGEPGVEGRGNNSPTTINIVRIALLANQNGKTKEERINKFFEILDLRLSQTRECLLYRRNILNKLKVKDLPFVAGEKIMKGSENLGPEDSIKPIIDNGTWAIGFIGLAEVLMILTGKHHGESEESQELGIKILTHMRKFCDEYKQKDSVNWSLYASPAEGLSGKFIKQDLKKFGKIKNITDKGFYTNSFHIPVDYVLPIYKKIKIEAPYHELCNGGHITYIELDDYPTGEIIEKIINYAFTQTKSSYVAVNFHIRYCKDCGERLHSENRCPKCGSSKIQGVSRVTGYMSLDERFGEGKYYERALRTSYDGKRVYQYGIKSVKHF